MEIQAVTKYNYKIFKNFWKFNMTKGFKKKMHIPPFFRKIAKAICIFYFVMFLLALIPVALFMVEEGSGAVKDGILTVCSLGFFFVFIYILPFHIVPKISFRQQEKFFNSEHNFTFKDNEFIFSIESPELSQSCVMKYSMLHEVYETDKYFYLYTLPTQAYVVDKSGITNGTADQIRVAVLNNLFPWQYIICK